MRKILPLPNLPSIDDLQSPKVVQVLDKIRFDLDKHDEFGEFCWFAREYPRCYRHHLSHAEHRLRQINATYVQAYAHFVKQMPTMKKGCFETSFSNQQVYELYWNFESYLSTVSSALDTLARLVGTAYESQLPISFKRLCSKRIDSGPAVLLLKAKSRWVDKMKNYRDCFVHFTPVDTMLSLVLRLYSNGWELRAKLPTNANVRDILGFKYSRRVDVLRYAISVYRNMSALDKAVGNEIKTLYRLGKYPKRINNLFFVGQRDSG